VVASTHLSTAKVAAVKLEGGTEAHVDAGSEERAPASGRKSDSLLRLRRWLRDNQIGQRFALIFVWVCVIGVFGGLEPSTFLTVANFSTIFGSQAILVVLALSLIPPLTAGDYDLSVAATLTFSAMIVAVLNVNDHWPIGWAILAAMGVGALIGIANGFLIVKLEVDSLIATLGMGTVVQGLVLYVSDSNTISGVSDTLVNATILTDFLSIPIDFYYGLGLCVVLWYFLEFTPAGRRLLFVGRGRDVARLSGVRVGRLRWGALIASSTLAAAAGVMFVGNGGGADPTSGLSFLLPAFAAVFLGETTIMPGRFNAWGTLVAAYFLITGITGLQLLGVASFVQQLFYGGALIVAVALAQAAKRQRERAG